MFKRSFAAAVCLLSFAVPTWPAGGGGGGGGGGAFGVEIDRDYQLGEAAIKRQDWQQAISRLRLVIRRDPRNADAWNYLGYAYRHVGKMDDSFKHYERALQLDPRHKGAHEYVGEAYLLVGKPAQAEEHLKALERICTSACEEYAELKEKLAAYKRGQPNTAAR